MKKLLFWSVVTMMTAASCVKGLESPATSGNGPVSFEATVDGADTKTVLDGVNSYWDGTERISVLDGTVSKIFEAADVKKAATATFSQVETEVNLTGDDYMAVYPSMTSVSWSGAVTDPVQGLQLPRVQHTASGTCARDAHVAVAYAEEDAASLAFKNVVSLIKFTVGNENVANPTFSGNNGEAVCGSFGVVYNNGNPEIVLPEGTVADECKSVSVYSSVEQGQTYYLAVLPGEFENGFTIKFEIEGKVYEKSTANAVTLNRNEILNLGTITVVTEEVTYRTTYFKPTEALKAGGAWFAAWAWLDSAEGKWYKMTDEDNDGIYEAQIPDSLPNVIFASMNSSASVADWDDKIYQTENLVFDAKNNSYAASYVNGESKIIGQWMTLEDAKTFVPPAPLRYLVGNFNGWNPADENYKMTLEGNYYVYKGLELSQVNVDGNMQDPELKICNGTWKESYGGTFTGKDVAISAVDNGANMAVPAGTYDVYFSADNTTIYFMTAGATFPPVASEPEVQ